MAARNKYDERKVAKLGEYLKIYSDRGQPIDYEIIVDGLKVVRRTDDPELFATHENFIAADTKAIEILLYTGTSNVNDKHIFTFGEDVKENGLSGVEIDERIKQQVDTHKKDIEHEAMKKEIAELNQEVSELEKTIERLEKENNDLVNAQSPFRDILGEVGSSLLESFIRRNPAVMKSIPGGAALSGLISPLPKSEDHSEEGSVSFQPKENSERLSEDDQNAIVFVNQLKENFTKPEFEQVLIILQALASDKSKIELIVNHVNLKQ